MQKTFSGFFLLGVSLFASSGFALDEAKLRHFKMERVCRVLLVESVASFETVLVGRKLVDELKKLIAAEEASPSVDRSWSTFVTLGWVATRNPRLELAKSVLALHSRVESLRLKGTHESEGIEREVVKSLEYHALDLVARTNGVLEERGEASALQSVADAWLAAVAGLESGSRSLAVMQVLEKAANEQAKSRNLGIVPSSDPDPESAGAREVFLDELTIRPFLKGSARELPPFVRRSLVGLSYFEDAPAWHFARFLWVRERLKGYVEDRDGEFLFGGTKQLDWAALLITRSLARGANAGESEESRIGTFLEI